MKSRFYIYASAFCLFLSISAQATVVEIRTNQGNIQVNLFDDRTPQTVANFLSYVNNGEYANNVVHRSASNFVIQMGGFQYNNDFPPDAIPTRAAVNNEPVLSNVRGTLAMAKLSGNPNSATSQFFINLTNNSSTLDLQNGGFTVFGQVIGDGMDVVGQIAGLPRFGFGGAFGELPLQNYTSTDATNGTTPTDNNLIIITDIVVIDGNTVTNPNLNPTPNTLVNSGGGQDPDIGGGSGGSLGVFIIAGLLASCCRKRKLHVDSQLSH